jgi:hypothetical protein
MRAENWRKEEFELEGWPVRMISYRIGDSWVIEVEVTSSGTKVACTMGKACEAAKTEALETAARRLLRTRRVDPTLTVGG